MIRNGYLLSLLVLFLSFETVGQLINLNYSQAKTNLRRDQLLGRSAISTSLNQWTNLTMADSISARNYLLGKEVLNKKSLSVRLLPATLKAVYNPSYPDYANDGLIAAQVGNQVFATAGICLNSKWFTLQFSPEVVYRNVKSFSPLPYDAADNLWRSLYSGWNRSEAITSGVNISETVYSFGQSAAYINLGKLSFGVSNANVFWGPGNYHGLLLSNHAPGFLHTSIHTNRPVNVLKTFNFEFQIIHGFLENSTFSLPFPSERYSSNPFINPKQNDQRYISAFNISLNPAFLPGLHVGFSRSIQQYWLDAQANENYFPIFDLFFRGNDNGRDDQERKDQLIALNTRWVMPEYFFEFYYVFGRNDASWNARDFIMSPQHSMSSIYGLTKLFELSKNRFFQINIESVQMAQSVNRTVRNAGSWYWHFQVRQGMTQKGEVLGSAIPLGSNQQLIDLSVFEGLENYGFKLSRTIVDKEFARTYTSQTGIEARWVQLSSTAYINYPWRSILFAAEVSFSRHRNFQYQLDENRTLINTQLTVSWVFE